MVYMFDYKKIPEEMKTLKRWVLWKKRTLENGKTTKIPVNAKNGYGAKSNDADTWVSFEEAINKIEYYNCEGLGFMLGNGYFGVDIDHAIDNKDLINEFVETLKSYTEKSQSGEGIHIICKGVLPVGNRRKGNIEMYDSARFFAMTGNVIADYTLNERTEEIMCLWQKYLNPQAIINNGGYVYHKESNNTNKITPLLSNDEVIVKAQESKSGALFNLLYYGQWEGVYNSQSEADAAFCSLLAFWTGKNAKQIDEIFRSSKLYREKWDTKRGAKTYGEITIQSAIDKCKDVYQVIENDNTKVYNPITGENEQKKDYDLSDTGNAQRFIDKFGDSIKYNHENKCWMIWDGKTWINDPKEIIKIKVDILIEDMKEEAIKERNEKYAMEMIRNIKHLASSSGKDAMLKEAQHIENISVVNADFDKDYYLLNCNNCVIDLRTGAVLPHDRKYMMSKNTHINIDLQNDCLLWKKTLNGIFKDSPDLIRYIQKAVGYSLTGDTKEHCLFQCYGNGSNGKSVFLNILTAILGDYGLNAQVESILTRSNNNSGNATPDIARMRGARFVRTNEPNEGARFNEGFVKQLTGGDASMTARFLYGKDFEFKPILKLWIACNYRIEVRGTDKGIWRRMRLIPFEATFEGKTDDKDIENKLKAELPQILGWAVKGCLLWQKEGLEMPKEVKEATKEYQTDSDKVEKFINECIKISTTGKEKASDVFRAYKNWAKDTNEWCMTNTKFGVELSKRFDKINRHGYVYYVGFILREHDQSYIYEKEQ